MMIEANLDAKGDVVAAAVSCSVDETSGSSLRVLDYFESSRGNFVFNTEENDTAAAILQRRSPLSSLTSKRAYDQIKSWISECSDPEAAKDARLIHSQCKAVKPKTLPKRVLDVGSEDQDPFLVAPEPGTYGTYVALSYCWDTCQPVILTQACLENGLPSFPFQNLHTTLRDAITICRNLNFQYLWIDALCIIQDSLLGEDWVVESGKVDSIYGNAALTIAVSGAKDTSEGMLHEAPVPIHKQTCLVSFRLPDERVGNAIIQFYPHANTQRQPLNNRAWTLQEHIMSARILSYQSDQLVWECRTMRKYANNPSHFLNRNLTEFTRRNMTVSSDRLAALSGYARFLHKQVDKNDENETAKTKNTYLAGLWSNSLPDNLLWFAVSYPHLPRPTLYRAPTWSWGSIDTGVHFAKPGRTVKTEVLDFSMATSALSPFGSIEPSPPSYLRLRGLIKPAAGVAVLPPRILRFPLVAITVDFNTGPHGPSQVQNQYVINFDTLYDAEKAASYVYLPNHNTEYFSYLSRLVPQWPQEIEKAEQAYLTELCPLWFLKMTESQALVLVPCAKDGLELDGNVYKRVGILTATNATYGTWFDNVKEKSTVTLI